LGIISPFSYYDLTIPVFYYLFNFLSYKGERGVNGSSPSGRGGGEGYKDEPGFCKAATLEEIASHDFVLTPGRYVGAADVEDDGIPFETKMEEMSQTLYAQMAEAARLDGVIRQNLEVLGYGE
ncbi:MAG: N-6 DNA methylase, partial [Nitrospirales bacterium]